MPLHVSNSLLDQDGLICLRGFAGNEPHWHTSEDTTLARGPSTFRTCPHQITVLASKGSDCAGSPTLLHNLMYVNQLG